MHKLSGRYLENFCVWASNLFCTNKSSSERQQGNDEFREARQNWWPEFLINRFENKFLFPKFEKNFSNSANELNFNNQMAYQIKLKLEAKPFRGTYINLKYEQRKSNEKNVDRLAEADLFTSTHSH